jgi:hypothetical protein
MIKNITLNNRMLATAVDRIRQNCNPGIVPVSGQWVPNYRPYRNLLKSLDDIVRALDINEAHNTDSVQRRHIDQA